MHDLMLSNAFMGHILVILVFLWSSGFYQLIQQPLSAWKEKSNQPSKQTMQVILRLICINSGYSYTA